MHTYRRDAGDSRHPAGHLQFGHFEVWHLHLWHLRHARHPAAPTRERQTRQGQRGCNGQENRGRRPSISRSHARIRRGAREPPKPLHAPPATGCPGAGAVPAVRSRVPGTSAAQLTSTTDCVHEGARIRSRTTCGLHTPCTRCPGCSLAPLCAQLRRVLRGGARAQRRRAPGPPARCRAAARPNRR